MNKEILYEILNSDSEKLPSAVIEDILNEELDKSPDEMDTDLIEHCLDALEAAGEKQLNKKKHRIKFTRVFAAAIIFILVIGISIPVCAKYLNVDVPKGLVTIYKNCFRVDISNNVYVDDIIGQLEQDGISEIALPKFVLSTETKVYNYVYYNQSDIQSVDYDFEYGNTSGHILLKKHNKKYVNAFTQENVPSERDDIECFNINNINVLVISNGKNSQIRYISNNTEYFISLDCSFEAACKIAETI